MDPDSFLLDNNENTQQQQNTQIQKTQSYLQNTQQFDFDEFKSFETIKKSQHSDEIQNQNTNSKQNLGQNTSEQQSTQMIEDSKQILASSSKQIDTKQVISVSKNKMYKNLAVIPRSKLKVTQQQNLESKQGAMTDYTNTKISTPMDGKGAQASQQQLNTQSAQNSQEVSQNLKQIFFKGQALQMQPHATKKVDSQSTTKPLFFLKQKEVIRKVNIPQVHASGGGSSQSRTQQEGGSPGVNSSGLQSQQDQQQKQFLIQNFYKQSRQSRQQKQRNKDQQDSNSYLDQEEQVQNSKVQKQKEVSNNDTIQVKFVEEKEEGDQQMNDVFIEEKLLQQQSVMNRLSCFDSESDEIDDDEDEIEYDLQKSRTIHHKYQKESNAINHHKRKNAHLNIPNKDPQSQTINTPINNQEEQESQRDGKSPLLKLKNQNFFQNNGTSSQLQNENAIDASLLLQMELSNYNDQLNGFENGQPVNTDFIDKRIICDLDDISHLIEDHTDREDDTNQGQDAQDKQLSIPKKSNNHTKLQQQHPYNQITKKVQGQNQQQVSTGSLQELKKLPSQQKYSANQKQQSFQNYNKVYKKNLRQFDLSNQDDDLTKPQGQHSNNVQLQIKMNEIKKEQLNMIKQQLKQKSFAKLQNPTGIDQQDSPRSKHKLQLISEKNSNLFQAYSPLKPAANLLVDINTASQNQGNIVSAQNTNMNNSLQQIKLQNGMSQQKLIQASGQNYTNNNSLFNQKRKSGGMIYINQAAIKNSANGQGAQLQSQRVNNTVTQTNVSNVLNSSSASILPTYNGPQNHNGKQGSAVAQTSQLMQNNHSALQLYQNVNQSMCQLSMQPSQGAPRSRNIKQFTEKTFNEAMLPSSQQHSKESSAALQLAQHKTLQNLAQNQTMQSNIVIQDNQQQPNQVDRVRMSASQNKNKHQVQTNQSGLIYKRQSPKNNQKLMQKGTAAGGRMSNHKGASPGQQILPLKTQQLSPNYMNIPRKQQQPQNQQQIDFYQNLQGPSQSNAQDHLGGTQKPQFNYFNKRNSNANQQPVLINSSVDEADNSQLQNIGLATANKMNIQIINTTINLPAPLQAPSSRLLKQAAQAAGSIHNKSHQHLNIFSSKQQSSQSKQSPVGRADQAENNKHIMIKNPGQSSKPQQINQMRKFSSRNAQQNRHQGQSRTVQGALDNSSKDSNNTFF